MTRRLLALICALVPMALSAQTIYRCTEAGGGVLISNTRVHNNCQAIVSEERNTVPAPRAPAARAASNPTPADFPRVQQDTQRSRDADRRHILEQELAGEQRKLDQARKELAEREAASGGLERATPYRERVAQHERNLQALQRELANLR
ncbi:DUF4124 domain-containing protein [uncultured Azonexus sp.]|uniref:DUF4124 domain-containing protein n=1 Tax=uncultured Azonexus sp. TaxID=520307 RepID=UPI00263661BA|nr:DUF4124 domain-containing protein [uncultured Azonexus sp.]